MCTHDKYDFYIAMTGKRNGESIYTIYKYRRGTNRASYSQAEINPVDKVEKEKDMLVHTTSDGQEMLVAQMGDQHLKRTIQMWIRKLQAAKARLDPENKPSAFEEAMYGETFSEDDAKKTLRKYDVRLAPYFLEAQVRGMDISAELEELQKIIDRKEQLHLSINVGSSRHLLDYTDDDDIAPF
jgi:hypothetical protein